MDTINIKHQQFRNPKISGPLLMTFPTTAKPNEDTIIIPDPEIIGLSRNIIEELADT